MQPAPSRGRRPGARSYGVGVLAGLSIRPPMRHPSDACLRRKWQASGPDPNRSLVASNGTGEKCPIAESPREVSSSAEVVGGTCYLRGGRLPFVVLPKATMKASPQVKNRKSLIVQLRITATVPGNP